VPDIRISTDLRQFLGPDQVRKVLAAPLARTRCPVCLQPVPPDGPVNVVISGDETKVRAAYAHPTCAPSSVMMTGTQTAAVLPDIADMVVDAVLLPHRSALLPVLITELPTTQLYHQATPSGELTDMLVSTMLRTGLALVPRLGDAPRTMLPWSTTIEQAPEGLSRLEILPRPGEPFYDGTVRLPTGWREAVERFGWCVLYSGTGLTDPAAEQATAATLRAASAAGTLTGGRLRITWTTPA
jgi:hypothetical protein